jgi:hypothetical protein
LTAADVRPNQTSESRNAELMVNGMPVPIERLMFLAQRDPYPGGLEFELRLECSELVGDLRRQMEGKEEVSHLTSDAAHRVFAMLNSEVSFMRLRRPDLSIAYIANTVSCIRLTKDTVVCRGICSPVLKE